MCFMNYIYLIMFFFVFMYYRKLSLLLQHILKYEGYNGFFGFIGSDRWILPM